jgi:hypothetical protein
MRFLHDKLAASDAMVLTPNATLFLALKNMVDYFGLKVFEKAIGVAAVPPGHLEEYGQDYSCSNSFLLFMRFRFLRCC